MVKRIRALAAVVALGGASIASAEVRLPDGAGKAIVETQCVKCHGLETVARAGYSREH